MFCIQRMSGTNYCGSDIVLHYLSFFFFLYHILLENIVALLMDIQEAIHAIWLLTQKEKGADVKTDSKKEAV